MVDFGKLTEPGRPDFVLHLSQAHTTIGRAADNSLVVDDIAISRHHARVECGAEGCYLLDLGSLNGTFLNGRMLEARSPQKLKDGDVVGIGSRRFVFQEGASSATDLSSPGKPAVEVSGKLYPFPGQQESCLIGRDPASDIVLAHPTVSRRHCRIFGRDGAYWLEDLGSTNGTFVNRVRVEQARPVQLGDLIQLGPFQLFLTSAGVQRATLEGALRLDALHLSKQVAGKKVILQDISLSIQPGEFVAIVGGSGSGKSTLLDALAGLRPASRGAVLINGTDLYEYYDLYRTQLGYVPQEDIVHKDLPVARALDYSARLRLPPDTSREERQERVNYVLAEMDLEQRRELPVRQLSGGQRKRVSIGVELLSQPSLFFLDEATSGLDPGMEAQIMRLLRKLADQGRTIVLVTHATKNVMMCDHVAFLARGGYLVYCGPPEGALEYFSVPDFDQIYEKLEMEGTPDSWSRKYHGSPVYQEAVVSRVKEVVRPQKGKDLADKQTGSQGVSQWRQFLVLSLRHLDILRWDRKSLFLMFLIAPVLGAMDFISWKRDMMAPVGGNAMQAMTMLFILSLVVLLVGTLTSVRELVKEVPIFRRERLVGLGVTPYVLSKVWVGLLFALYNAAVLLVTKLLAVDFSYLSNAEVAAFYVTVALGTMSGVLWGLFISSISPNEERAMLLLILVLVPAFVFSGGMLEVSAMGTPGRVLGSLTTSKWDLGALATVTGIRERPPGILGLPGEQQQAMLKSLDDRYGDIFQVDLLVSWGAMLLLMAILLGITILMQRRRAIVR